MQRLCIYFAAGAYGGLVNSLLFWVLGAAGIVAALGLPIAPELTPDFLYKPIVWGGIFGWVFLLPIFKQCLFKKASVLSLLPSIGQLFVVFPSVGAGFMGLSLGIMTPVFVLFLNWVWAMAAAVIIKITGR